MRKYFCNQFVTFGGNLFLKKRILSFFLMLLVFVGMIPLTAINANAAYTLIKDRDVVDGSLYTESSAMAEKLNDIFDGNASIYANRSCTTLVNTVLGSSPVKNNGVPMFVGPEGGKYLSSGTSCFIYANGVYYTLFGESTGSGTAGENSEKLNLSVTRSRSGSYANFKAWGVRQGVGALIRASGHSMIVLDYDEDSITILDGNSDGRGRVSICTRSWDNFSKFYYISYIIQPTDSHYAALYGCGTCGDDLNWFVDDAGTLTITGTGEILYPGWINYSDSIKKVVIEDGVTGINAGVFHGCKNVEEIFFSGNAPAFNKVSFLGVTATVHYPATDRGWTTDVQKPYGGNLTWDPYGETELKITDQPETIYVQSGDSAEVSIAAEGDGLTYTWYTKNAGEDLFVKSSVTGPNYCMMMSEQTKDRQVLCIITDQYGNSVVSEQALLRMYTPIAKTPVSI